MCWGQNLRSAECWSRQPSPYHGAEVAKHRNRLPDRNRVRAGQICRKAGRGCSPSIRKSPPVMKAPPRPMRSATTVPTPSEVPPLRHRRRMPRRTPGNAADTRRYRDRASAQPGHPQTPRPAFGSPDRAPTRQRLRTDVRPSRRLYRRRSGSCPANEAADSIGCATRRDGSKPLAEWQGRSLGTAWPPKPQRRCG